MTKRNSFKLMLALIAVTVIAGCSNSIHTSVDIKASRHDTWKVLTDFDKYPQWNPFVKKIGGDVKPGKVIQVQIQPEDGDSMDFEPTVLRYEDNLVLEWEGRLLMPGIFTGKHTFVLEEIGPNETRLIQKEEFQGILVPFFNFDGTEAGFNSMNQELKKRAENL